MYSTLNIWSTDGISSIHACTNDWLVGYVRRYSMTCECFRFAICDYTVYIWTSNYLATISNQWNECYYRSKQWCVLSKIIFYINSQTICDIAYLRLLPISYIQQVCIRRLWKHLGKNMKNVYILKTLWEKE